MLPTPTSGTTFSCVVTDDDSLSRHVLESHIGNTPNLILAASFPDGVQLLQYLKSQPSPDVLFLDVQMPLLNGLEVLRMLPTMPAVVLTTSMADFAVEAFALRVVDYLIKPIEYPRFFQAVQRVQEWKERGADAALPQLEATLRTPTRQIPQAEDFFFVKTGGRMTRIPVTEILYVEAVGQYAVVVTMQQQYSTNHLLHEVVNRLPTNCFERVHRSYVINWRNIESVEDSMILLKGGREVPIGRTYLKDFLERLNR